MNVRGRLYLAYVALRGSRLGRYYREFVDADARGSVPAPEDLLARVLRHARDHVRWYAERMRGLPDPGADPIGVLRAMQPLTKAHIRMHHRDLQSDDLDRRSWRFNTSGGSTGEPVRFVQDDEFDTRTSAVALAFSHWAGHRLGDAQVLLWGSERDVLRGTDALGKRLANRITRTTFLNAFRMTPDLMRDFAEVLRKRRPRLIVSYAQALYELAGFLEANAIRVAAPAAVITSAGTLHDEMRERLVRVFRCPVYNRYGSREVGLIAAERPGVDGMWVPPWTTFVEVTDGDGNPVPAGETGEILVTSLANYTMPLIRFRIGDRGVMRAERARGGQVMERVLGRNVDVFRRRDGTIVDGEYFTHLVYACHWVEKFQFVQRDYDDVLLRVVTSCEDAARIGRDLEEIRSKARAALGDEVVVTMEQVRDIPSLPSGKYRYTISEVPRDGAAEGSARGSRDEIRSDRP